MAGLLDLFGLGGLLGGQVPQQQQMPPQMQQMPVLPQPADPNPFGAAIANYGHGNSLVGGLADAFLGLTTGQRTDPVGRYQQQSNQVYQSLLRAGYPEPQARLAAVDPATLKNITALPEIKETGTDPFTGQKSFAEYRPQIGTLTPLGGQPGQGQPGQGPGGSLVQFQNAVNAGVTGNDLYQHLPAGMRPTIQAMIEGRRAPPTGMGMRNPAVLAMVEAAHAIDPQFDETTWGARNKMITQLSSTAPNTLGGQLNIGNTAVGHLADASEAALDLGNVDWGIGFLTQKANEIKNATTAQRNKIQQLQTYAQRYGQEITKFYAGGPGGEAERSRFLDQVDASKSPQELAGVFQAEARAMDSRIRQYESQIQTTLGPAGSQKYPVIRPETEKEFQRINENVSKLKGQSGVQPQQAAPGQPAVAAAAPGAAALARTPPPAAIQALKANPALRSQFDAYYGAGSSQKALGGG